MAGQHVVVDGSNIATEGRSLPSLRQLDEAVREFMAEHPHDRVTVVVDATFGHRIQPGERAQYEEAVANGELITPPAGAIGRGDAFVLQIAHRANATVLSNDSFQEFHGTYPWLFDEGRLIGGKPVPGVGWIFVLRTPVRGPASRRSVRAAKKVTPPAEKASAPKAAATRATKAAAKAAEHAHPADTRPAVDAPARSSTRSRRRRSDTSTAPQNDLSAFIDFVAAHPVGSVIEGVVSRFSSHGAYVMCDDAECYIALRSLGDPPPRSAREVLTLGASRAFVVQAIDAPRRGIDLALADVEQLDKTDSGPQAAKAAATAAGTASIQEHAEEARVAPAAKKAPARKTAAKKTAAKKAPARKAAVKRAPAKKTAAKKAPARKAVAKKAPAKKASAKKAAVKKAPARKTAAKKTTAKRAPARKTTKK